MLETTPKTPRSTAHPPPPHQQGTSCQARQTLPKPLRLSKPQSATRTTREKKTRSLDFIGGVSSVWRQRRCGKRTRTRKRQSQTAKKHQRHRGGRGIQNVRGNTTSPRGGRVFGTTYLRKACRALCHHRHLQLAMCLRHHRCHLNKLCHRRHCRHLQVCHRRRRHCQIRRGSGKSNGRNCWSLRLSRISLMGTLKERVPGRQGIGPVPLFSPDQGGGLI